MITPITIGSLSMDSTTAWASVDDLVDALSTGEVSTGLGAPKPSAAAVHGAKVAMRLLRREGAAITPPPAILAMPWGSIVFWWRSFPQRRIEVVGRDEAYEFLESPEGTVLRRFM